MDHEWLFIGGISRSGTTLMARLLSLHPEAFITAETFFALDLYWGLTCPPSGYNYADFRCGVEVRTVSWMFPRLTSYDSAEDITRAMCVGYMEHLHPEARVVGDKTPMPGAFHPIDGSRRVWEDLRHLWPDCRLLFMDRDLDEAVASAKRVWNEPEDVARAQALERREGQRLCPDGFRVQLEELNADPRRVMSMVLRWANLPISTYPWDEFDVYFQSGHRVN